MSLISQVEVLGAMKGKLIISKAHNESCFRSIFFSELSDCKMIAKRVLSSTNEVRHANFKFLKTNEVPLKLIMVISKKNVHLTPTK